jgi:hypothetical protein
MQRVLHTFQSCSVMYAKYSSKILSSVECLALCGTAKNLFDVGCVAETLHILQKNIQGYVCKIPKLMIMALPLTVSPRCSKKIGIIKSKNGKNKPDPDSSPAANSRHLTKYFNFISSTMRKTLKRLLRSYS